MNLEHVSIHKPEATFKSSGRATIAAHIPTYNCPELLLKCVAHIMWVDEIIIADNSSNDSIRRIIPQIIHPNVKYFYCEEPDIRIRLNDLKPETDSDYILWVCTDEFYTANAGPEIIRALSTTEDNLKDGYLIPSESYLFNEYYGKGDTLLRLFRKHKFYFEMKSMHDAPKVKGTVGQISKGYHHYQCPTMSSQVNKIFFYAANDARILDYEQLMKKRLDTFNSRQVKLHFFLETLRMLWRTRKIYFKKNVGYITLMQQYEHILNIISADCAPTEEYRLRDNIDVCAPEKAKTQIG